MRSSNGRADAAADRGRRQRDDTDHDPTAPGDIEPNRGSAGLLRDSMARHPDAPDIGNFSRRGFLVAAAGSAALVSRRARAQAVVEPLESLVPTFFTAAEWPLVIALCDTLIPAEGDGPGAVEARVPVFLDLQMASPWGQSATWYMQGPHVPDADPLLGFQAPLSLSEIIRQGLGHFSQWCLTGQGGAFDTLDVQHRHDAVDALMAHKIEFPPELRDFPDFLLTSVRQGYLSDPRHGGNHGMLAWVHVGYPGARGNYLSWTNPARDASPYILGPVSISGERG